jgi:hypothetical protein
MVLKGAYTLISDQNLKEKKSTTKYLEMEENFGKLSIPNRSLS